MLTHHPPATVPRQDGTLTFTFVTDGAASAVTQARAAAGDRDVQVVGGAGVIQELLHEGLVDELHIDIVPEVLGGGQRLFAEGGLNDLNLALLRVETTGQRAGLRLAVKR